MFYEVSVTVRRPDFDDVHCETAYSNEAAASMILSIGKIANSFDHGSADSLLINLRINGKHASGLTISEAVHFLDSNKDIDKGKLEIYYWEEEKTWRCTHKTKSDDNEYLFDTFADVTKWILNRYL